MQRMKNKVVLDASALLALLNGEKGADAVKQVLKASVMSTVNLAEVLTVIQRLGIPTEEAAEDIMAMVKEILPFNAAHAELAAHLNLKTQSKGLSLGDRACLALAIDQGLAVFTADKAWKNLELDEAEIHLIR